MQRLRGLLMALLIAAMALLGVACEGGANVDLGGEGGEAEGGVEGEIEGEVGGEGEEGGEGDY